jgi:Spy/CpxP family protein refolding chaperone
MTRSLRILGGAGVVLMMVLVATASAQQKGKGRNFGFGGFGGGLVSTAANEAVQKDLGVSSDLGAKITSLRDDYNAARQKEYQTAGINPQDFQNLSDEQRQKMGQISNKLSEEFDPKLKELLSADQLKRLNQIRLQSGLANVGPTAITAPEVANELGLTDEQRQKLNSLARELGQQARGGGGGGFDPAAFAKRREERIAKTEEILTAEQKEKLAKLKGSPFDVSQLTAFGGRRGKGN